MTTQPIDTEKRVGQYVSLRDKIKELDDAHKASMKPYKDMLEQLGNMLLSHLNDVKAESIKSSSGTFYKIAKKTASLEDPEAFMRFVIANNLFDMLDRKANVAAVSDYIEAQNALPPGVKFTTRIEVGVRRS
jgi:hypothetical protein